VFGNFSPPYSNYIEFRDWVEITYSIVFKDGEKLFSFSKCPDCDGGDTWVFLSTSYEININFPVLPLKPLPTYYLLRKRGEVTPLLTAEKIDGEFTEISYAEDSGTYTLEAEPTAVQSYCGGGGLFILSMEPGENFSGDVQLSLDASPGLNAKLTTDLLSLDEKIAEIEIYPDSSLTRGVYTFEVISEHAGFINKLDLSVEIVLFGPFGSPDSMYIEFIEWVEITYPIVFKDGEQWFSFFKYPDYDGASTWIYLSPTFEIYIIPRITPSSPTRYLLRNRGEVTPVLAAKKEKGGEYLEIIEVPFEDLWN